VTFKTLSVAEFLKRTQKTVQSRRHSEGETTGKGKLWENYGKRKFPFPLQTSGSSLRTSSL